MTDYASMEEFLRKREEQNTIVTDNADKVMKRIFSVDSFAYQEGALSEQVKELIGLTTSLVLRCDDCIAWHINRCAETGVTREQLVEALGIGTLVGGTITIPHVRRALVLWDSISKEIQ